MLQICIYIIFFKKIYWSKRTLGNFRSFIQSRTRTCGALLLLIADVIESDVSRNIKQILVFSEKLYDHRLGLFKVKNGMF